MLSKKFLCFLFLSLVTLSGCRTNQNSDCKPVLFPYVEYEYKAEPQKISGGYISETEEIIDFHGLKLPVPQGWHYKKVFSGRTIKFFKDKHRSFIVSFKDNNDIWCDIESFSMMGCKKNSLKSQETARTKKEFYTELYLFTDDQLDRDPTFWQYYILWAKTKFLHDVDKLIHYTGENLEAFQRNSKFGPACTKGGVVMQSEIFPQEIAPDYLSIAAGFIDDAFFAIFLSKVDTLNP